MRILFLSTCLLAAECMKERPQSLSLGNMAIRISKRRIQGPNDLLLDRFDSSHCIHKFETSTRTVVLAKESQENGAFFINETLAYSYKSCLKSCCETLGCNTAIWDQNTNFCYLFDCGSREDFKCLFDSHNMFTTGLLRVERSDLDMESRDYHRTRLQNLSPSRNQYSLLEDPKEEGTPKEECGRYQFTCHSGECVAIYDVCNGIPQCEDGSDENPAQCPTSTTTTAVPSYSSPPVQANPFLNKMAPSLFHHQNAGLQVANNGPYAAYQPILSQPFGYNVYGKPFSSAPNPPMPQKPVTLSTEDDVKAQEKGKNNVVVVSANSTSPVDRTTSAKKKTPTDISGHLSTPNSTNTALDKVEEMKNALIKDLKEMDLIMETPSAAIFTLIVGMSLSAVLILILACKIRQRRGIFGGKRNLLADADGDYLVNGMYL